MELSSASALLDRLLEPWREVLGTDRLAYRNHCQRTLRWFTGIGGPDVEGAAVALAYHDLGIWSADTFDYLAPSEALLRAAADPGDASRVDDLAAAIRWHHKLLPYRGPGAPFVEAFRRADLVDVSAGLLRAGIPRRLVKSVQLEFPDEGFHWRLLQIGSRWAVRHPARPMPMLRL